MTHYSQNPTLCNLSWIRARQIQLTISLGSLDPHTKRGKRIRNQRLLQMMAYLNYKIWCIANKYGVFSTDFKVNPQALYRLVNISLAGELTGEWSTQNMSKYIQERWKGAFFSENSIRVIRDFISGLGIFNFEKPAPGSTWKPPELTEINFIDAILLYEALEIEFLSRSVPDPEGGERDRALKDLPSKFGATVRNIFNVLFQGVASYNRRDRDYESAIIEQDPVPCPPGMIPDENGEVDLTPAAKCDWKVYFKEIMKRINDKKRKKNKNHAQTMKNMGIDPSLNKNPYGWWGAKPEY
jgi:hypothetical protein